MRHEIRMPRPRYGPLLFIIPGTGVVILKKYRNRRTRADTIKKTTLKDRQVILLSRRRALLHPALAPFQIGQKILQRQRYPRRTAVNIDADAFPMGFAEYINPEKAAKSIHSLIFTFPPNSRRSV